MTLGSFASTACHADTTFAETNDAKIYERTAMALGTTVRIIVRHKSKKAAHVAISTALDELELLESVMSVYRPESQLSQLNHHRELLAPHPYLVRILRQAADVSAGTHGAFDITVQSLWQSYRESADTGRLPDARTIRDARKTVGYRNVEIVGGRIRLTNGARVTLNGIAQGFATDRVKRSLVKHEISHALIDVGELASLGSKSGGQPWRAGIQHPRREDAFVSTTPIRDRCLATSGDYETAFTDDFRAHHIFDPRTGVSPSELASVSVLAPTATEADALSTALLVMGLRQGAALLNRKKNVDALFVRKDGRVAATRGFSMG